MYELIDVSTAPPKIEFHRQVAQEEIVGEMLLEIRVLLALADVDSRLGRRERVRQHVPDVLAVDTVGIDILVDARAA